MIIQELRTRGLKDGRVNIVGLLKTCAKQKDLSKGSELHAYVRNHKSLYEDCYIASSLVSMYARCGVPEKAQQVLYELPVRNVVTWNALIAGYTQQGQGEEALKCFYNMQQEGHCPDDVTFICVLKACGNTGATAKGEEMHKKIVSLGILEKNILLGNTLIDMYAKCGAVAKAQQVFDELTNRDAITWTSLIGGYAQYGQGEKALNCFYNMQCEGYCPSTVTFICALKACGCIGAVAMVERLHDKIASLGMLKENIVLGSTLVDMYARCGALAKAQQLLNELPVRDVIMWTVLVAGYAQQGQGEEALKCFDNMQREGHSPNVVTFICALKACGSIQALVKGEQIHKKLLTLGLLDKDVDLSSTLVDTYARCGALAKARQVLNRLSVRDVITWNALIGGYARHGQGEEALECFSCMQREGLSPDVVTFLCVLKACGSIGDAAKVEYLHEKIVSLGLLEKNIMLGNTLVDIYARCGALVKAKEVLDKLPVRDVIMWTALIVRYIEQGHAEEAIKCFDDMQLEGHFPNAVTFLCALKAYGIVGATGKGEKIHHKIVSLGLLEKDILLGNTLVEMYAKCAQLAKAVEVLELLPIQDVVTWNTLIGGYAQQGESEEALKCFERMQCRGVMPDSTTLVHVLNSCSHTGQLYQAEMYFWRMDTKYGFAPALEHYCCMVDLFGRAGEIEKALAVVEKMPSADSLPVWFVLLGACYKQRDVGLGRLAFDHALYLDNSDAAAYVSMANMYITGGVQEGFRQD